MNAVVRHCMGSLCDRTGPFCDQLSASAGYHYVSSLVTAQLTRTARMILVPVPGATEAELAAKVANSVVKGLRAASQPSPWPDTREALPELHAILHEWVERPIGWRCGGAL